MIFRRRMIRTVFVGLLVVGSAAAWVTFAPIQFGGETSYVIIAGASMEPALRQGDLVIVRESQEYDLDDVVTYQHPRVGPIIHRIIDRRADGFVLKGDNNDWTDGYRPTSEEIVGVAWLHLPRAGQYLSMLRNPLYLAALSFGISAMLFLSFRKGKSSTNSEDPFYRRLWEHPVIPKKAGDDPEGLLFAFAILGFASLILAFVAFRRPVFVSTEQIIDYRQSGTFRYFASAPPDVYDSRVITTGDPIFLRLTDEMEVRFEYEIAGDELENLSGTHALTAEISDRSGWRRIIEIEPKTSFAGSSFSTAGKLDFNQIAGYVQSLEESTGINHPSYTLSIYPVVRIEGKAAEQDIAEFFNPRLDFIYDDLQVQLLQSNPSAPNEDPVNPSLGSMLMTPQLVPGTISILTFELPVSTARWIAGVGLLLALIGLGWFGTLVYRASQTGGDTLFRLKYSGLIVDVTEGIVDKNEQVIEVASMNDLARLAQQNKQKILHDEEPENHRYFIRFDGVVYLFNLEKTRTAKGVRSNGSGNSKKSSSRAQAKK